jgi:ABC-2 type transport system ATP-binding protein
MKRIVPEWVEAVQAMPFVKEAQAVESKLVISLADPEEQNPVLVRRLVELGAEVQFVGELRHSLEDIYLQFIRQ